MCDLSVYCTVICFVLLLFLFLFVSYDLSAGLVKLGKSRSLSVSVLVEGCTCHLRCLWQLLRSWVVLQGPPLVLQREYILIGPNVGCSDLCMEPATFMGGESQLGRELTPKRSVTFIVPF